jgi:hypothetical protein
MDPLEKLSKKTLSSIDMNSSRHISSKEASSTQENFFRKTGSKSFTSKSDTFGTIIQIIKSDIFQIQETVNDNSSILKMFKIVSKNSTVSKKIAEIEESRDIKLIIDRLTDEANNVDKTCKYYGCNNLNELVQKLTLEVSYYDLFIKKINDLFFIMNLKQNGEDNLYQDTFSKFFLIKLVLDKFNSNSGNVQQEQSTPKEQSNNNLIQINNNVDSNTFITNNDDMKESGEFSRLAEIRNLNDLVNEYNNDENKVIKNIVNIFKDFLTKLSLNYADLINKNGKKSDGFDVLQFDKFLTQKLLIEKIIAEKDKEISALNSSYNDLNTKSVQYDEIIQKREKEIEELKDQINKFKSSATITEAKEQPQDVKSLLKVIEESKIILTV